MNAVTVLCGRFQPCGRDLSETRFIMKCRECANSLLSQLFEGDLAQWFSLILLLLKKLVDFTVTLEVLDLYKHQLNIAAVATWAG